MHYRRNNTLVPAKFHDNVLAALAVVDRRMCHMFARRAREYRNAQRTPEYGATFDKIEACRKTFKTHRNAVDYEKKFIRSSFQRRGGTLPAAAPLVGQEAPVLHPWTRGPKFRSWCSCGVSSRGVDSTAVMRIDRAKCVKKLLLHRHRVAPPPLMKFSFRNTTRASGLAGKI